MSVPAPRTWPGRWTASGISPMRAWPRPPFSPEDASATVLRGRAGHRQDVTGDLAGPGPRGTPDPAAVPRGNRRLAGAVRLGLPTSAPAPAGHRGLLDGRLDADAAEQSLYTERFLLARPLLRALRSTPCVLLVDEIDRADDEFEAFLLEVLGEYAVTIPEFGEVRAKIAPLVVLTSNRTREVHDALKRRCLYHWLEHPASPARSRSSGAGCRRSATGSPRRWRTPSARLRDSWNCSSRRVSRNRWTGPRRCCALGRTELDAESAAITLGAVLKYREDSDRVRLDLDVAAGVADRRIQVPAPVRVRRCECCEPPGWRVTGASAGVPRRRRTHRRGRA